MRIGVLAVEGSFDAHLAVLADLGVAGVAVRTPADLGGVAGLILPGGRSPAMGERLIAAGLEHPIRLLAAAGRPIWGTCAGLVLLASSVGREQPLLGLIDMTVERAAFGRQRETFTEPLTIGPLGPRPFPALFIRAPVVETVEPGVRILACLDDGTIVAVQQGACLATAFHPERTSDRRFHRYFLRLCGRRPVAECGRLLPEQ